MNNDIGFSLFVSVSGGGPSDSTLTAGAIRDCGGSPLTCTV